MKEYSEYKPSGIEWIGDIPQDWKICKIKYICRSVYAGGTPDTNNKDYWNGDIPWIVSGSVHDSVIYEPDKFITKKGLENSSTKLIPTNTAVLAMTGATCGNVGVLKFTSCTNQSVTSFINKEYTSFKYLFYVLLAARYEILLKRNGSAQSGINVNDCKNIVIPCPNHIKQKKISDFLDHKTEKIGALISGKEKLVELLKEQRRSIISETVTKGLDKKTEMKPSGVEWIGNIPITWEIKKMKYIAELYPKYRISSAVNDMDVTFSPMECVRTGILEQRLSKFSNYSSSYNIFKNGDILMAKLISCFENGNIVIAKDLSNGIGFGSSELFIIRCFGVNTEYMFYYFQNNTFVEMAKSTTQGVTLKRVSVDFIKNSQIPIPDREEQKKIVSYLNEKTSQIGNLIENLTKQIKKLQEYRKSIVSEAVTGKAAI